MISDFWLGWRELAGFALRKKAVAAVRAIAEGLVFGHAAPAQRDQGTATQTIRVSFGILDDKFALDPNRPVVDNRHFRGHAAPMVAEEFSFLTAHNRPLIALCAPASL